MQGTGDKVFAIDATVVINSLKKLKADWKLERQLDTSANKEIPEIAAHVKSVDRDLGKAIASKRDDILKAWADVESKIGASPDKDSLVKEVNLLIDSAKQAGYKPPMSSSAELGRLVESFRDAPVKTCLEHINKVKADESGGSLLSALAQFDDSALNLLVDFTVQVDC